MLFLFLLLIPWIPLYLLLIPILFLTADPMNCPFLTADPMNSPFLTADPIDCPVRFHWAFVFVDEIDYYQPSKCMRKIRAKIGQSFKGVDVFYTRNCPKFQPSFTITTDLFCHHTENIPI